MNTIKRFWALCLDTHMKLALYKYAIIIIIIIIIVTKSYWQPLCLGLNMLTRWSTAKPCGVVELSHFKFML